MNRLCLLLALAALVAAPGTGIGQTPTGIKDITYETGVQPFKPVDDIYVRFAEGYRKLDPAVFMDLYTGDALYLPAPAPVIVRGNGEINKGFAAFFNALREQKDRAEIVFRIVDRRISADMAADVGVYTLWVMKPNGEKDKFRGKFVVVAIKDKDGAWRFHVDGFSDLPPEEPVK